MPFFPYSLSPISESPDHPIADRGCKVPICVRSDITAPYSRFLSLYTLSFSLFLARYKARPTGSISGVATLTVWGAVLSLDGQRLVEESSKAVIRLKTAEVRETSEAIASSIACGELLGRLLLAKGAGEMLQLIREQVTDPQFHVAPCKQVSSSAGTSSSSIARLSPSRGPSRWLLAALVLGLTVFALKGRRLRLQA